MAECDPNLRALKSLFLGPQSENGRWLEKEWVKVLRHWGSWRSSLFPQDGAAITESDQTSPAYRARRAELASRLDEMLAALEKESPKFTPRYLGHMVSELSLPGILGHVAALLHNPNQTSREVSRATSVFEAEAIADLLKMAGLPAHGRGHFTSGGTMANLEFVWRALFRLDQTLSLALHLCASGRMGRESFERTPCLGWNWFEKEKAQASTEELLTYSFLHLGAADFSKVYERVTGHTWQSPVVLAPASRHYSWPKAVTLTGLGQNSLWDIPLDENGRLSLPGLREAFARAERENRTVVMVVSVAGATGTGAVDPVHLVQDFLREHQSRTGNEVWHHVDAAYGGYFCTLLEGKGSTSLGVEARSAFKALKGVQSLTLDPHKLGFIPYSCGAFLSRDELHYRAPSFAAPYLLADNAGAWIHTIEGSRAATGVAATWLANRTIGLDVNGYGGILGLGLNAARAFASMLKERPEEFLLVEPFDLNILNFSLARKGEHLSQINARTLACFEKFRGSPNFSISKTELSCQMYPEMISKLLLPRNCEIDAPNLITLRLVLMNPFLTTRETNTPYLAAFLQELIQHAQLPVVERP